MGIAIVLPVPAGVGYRIYAPKGSAFKVIKPASMHLTLAYLQGIYTATDTKTLLARVKAFFARKQPVEIKLSGVGRFTVVYGEDPFFVTVNPTRELVELRSGLCGMLDYTEFAVDETFGFYPHVTIAYLKKTAASPKRRLGSKIRFMADTAVVLNSWDDSKISMPFSK